MNMYRHKKLPPNFPEMKDMKGEEKKQVSCENTLIIRDG